MPTPQDIQTATARLSADSAILHAIVHGLANAVVATENGNVPTVAKAISDIAAQISNGYAQGYVVVVANAAARALSVPSQAGQLLLQLDTLALYYAPNLIMGSWAYHPVQNAANDATNALNAVVTLTTSLGTKMTTSAYVGNGAVSDVRTAERLRLAVTYAADHPGVGLRVYGVENGALGMYPAALPNGAGSLVDGTARRSAVTNTSRRCLAPGTNFAILSTPGRLVSWGAQPKAGILASGVNGVQSFFPRAVVARQQPDRVLPGFDSHSVNTVGGQIVEICSQGACTVARTADGLILVAGATAQGVKPIFGSNVDKNQNVLMPVYFNDGGTNMPIRLFDVVDSVATTTASTAIFVDETEAVWLLTTNPKASGYGQTPPLVGAQNVPVKISGAFASWDGKLIKKIRCDTSGGIYILFTNGELWAGGGSNVTGLLGTGAATNVLNPLQILTGVVDFDISGHGADTAFALWVLQGSKFKAAGYNASGQFGQGNYLNKSSFVDVAGGADINMVRIGGTDNVTVFYRTTAGTWYGVGVNTDGVFGEGVAAAKNFTPRILANLTTLLATNGGFVDLVVSGYAGKHAACVLCTNGKAFTAGNNTDGILANGFTTAATTWQEVLWSPLDPEEKIVDVSTAVGPAGGPAFAWRTNYGRVLQAGSAVSGFATGIAPPVAYGMLTASPVQLNFVL